MRVWDIHPGYLSYRSLLGEHSEIHAIYNIVSQKKSGYSNHPETLRWAKNLRLLVHRHDLIVKEMTLRKFNHNSSLLPLPLGSVKDNVNKVLYIDLPETQFEILHKKYTQKNQIGRIPLPVNGSEFWAHHKYSIMGRGYQYYKELQQFLKNRKNYPIGQEHDLIQKIQICMEMQVTFKALNNVIEHLWGYFKNTANLGEKKYFFNLPDPIKKLSFLYELVEKYQQKYLKHSTIFADFLPN